MVSESEILGGDGCVGTGTLGTDAVPDTTLRYGAGWCTTTVDCGVNSNGNVCRGKGGVSGVSISCGSRIARLIIVAICFIGFCVSSQNESEVTILK